MIRKHAGLIAAVLLLVLAFAGCSASKSARNTAAVAPAASAEYASNAGSGMSGSPGYAYDTAVAVESERYSEGHVNKEDIRKIIKNGEIAVEVKDVDAAYAKILYLVKGLGGEEFNKSYYSSNGHKRMELVLKIPPEKLDEFQAKLAELVGDGKIKHSSIRSEDITMQYYDADSRLKSYKASKNQLDELLKEAKTVEETLNIHREITRLQAEIESLQGQINLWDKLVSMATITLYIDEEDDPLRHTKTADWRFSSLSDIWSAMKNGFITVINTIYSLIVWLFIIIVSLLPVLIPAGIILWLVLRRKRKNKGNTPPPPLA